VHALSARPPAPAHHNALYPPDGFAAITAITKPAGLFVAARPMMQRSAHRPTLRRLLDCAPSRK